MKLIAPFISRASDQQWAAGCSKCKHGIASAPELTGACELYLERLVQAIAHDITFCDCMAGGRYRVFLLNRRQILIEEARKDKRMVKYAALNTHPEIEWAQARVVESYSMLKMPTIHYEEIAPKGHPATGEPA